MCCAFCATTMTQHQWRHLSTLSLRHLSNYSSVAGEHLSLGSTGTPTQQSSRRRTTGFTLHVTLWAHRINCGSGSPHCCQAIPLSEYTPRFMLLGRSATTSDTAHPSIKDHNPPTIHSRRASPMLWISLLPFDLVEGPKTYKS
jgi:hypothetical protein